MRWLCRDPGLRSRAAHLRQPAARAGDRRADRRDDAGPAGLGRPGRPLSEPDLGGGMTEAAGDPNLDPITIEVIGSALSSIVEEMGEALVRASFSTNIKERRDCSTALFDPSGAMLCQAEHIPMHLGSFIGILPHIVRRTDPATIAPGDVFIGNDAYEGGGTHLPDIVLAEPIFVDGEIVAWTVNLAHHSDFADRGHAHIYQEGLR